MKNIKKILVLALALALVVSMFAGCGKKDDVYKVGMVQLVQHDALDAASKGFQDALIELLGEDKINFDYQIAAGDANTCSTIVSQFTDVDMIFANATPALQAAAAYTVSTPIVATSITDYATALDIDDWTGVTGRNITGTADLAPLADQAAMFKELLPNAKNIGLLYCSGEANSKYQVDIVAAELEAMGYTTTRYTFADSNDIAAVVTTANQNSDALYIPTDNTAASNTEIIANIVTIPVIASEEGICKGCGIATLSISYYDLGYVTGEMAYEVLVNGADPSTMEVRYTGDLTKKYVASRMAQFGITPPEDYVALDE